MQRLFRENIAPPRSAPWRGYGENNMASAGAAIWLPDTERFFMELGTMITRAQQQRNATATQFDSSEFFVRRLEEYERTLSVLTTRIEESFAQEITLIGYLHQLLGILNELRRHFEAIAEESEGDIDSFEESATQPIVTITRNGEVGRPRLALAREQLETLHGEAGFRWADVARILNISERTVRRRRLEFGLPVGRDVEFSDISDEELDSHVRQILRTTPRSGRRFVQGGLRNRGLRIQRRRIEESMRRVDPVICTLRAAQHIIRRVYSVPSPNALW